MDRFKPIFTVGHSTHELDHFIALLTAHGISTVADVRSDPYSRIPHFNRDALAAALKTRNIAYEHFGRELGARRAEENCYIDGQAVYELIAALPLFRQGIDRLLHTARQHVVALMCSEKEPLDCHRTVLVCRHLRPYETQINHILANGELESHPAAEHRLMELMGMSPEQGNLFADRQQLIEQAYQARGKEIAYRADLQGATP